MIRPLAKRQGVVLSVCALAIGWSWSCKADEATVLQLFQEGKKAYINRELQKSSEFFTNVIDTDSSFLPAYIMLGKTFYFQGKMRESETILSKGLDRFPGNATLRFWRARVYLAEGGKNELAKRELEAVLESDENQFEAHYYLAKILESEGKIREALLEYNRAKYIKIGFDKIHRDLGKLYEEVGLPEKAAIERNSLAEAKK
ncbi:tetratricopeptide repeat protein [Leptospira inadai]|nr:tetratricopeptide repeat protein [Leptospira inadai]